VKKVNRLVLKALLGALALALLSGCTPSGNSPQNLTASQAAGSTAPQITATPFLARPEYKPGELVDYAAQTGDTLPALAAHFNTTVDEILAANPIIPANATTLPPDLPMKIPIYYLPLWGSQFHILPDHAFVNGPTAVEFDTQTFVDAYPGWLKDYRAYVGGRHRSGAEIVDYVALNFSVNPRLLLALLEYQSGALTQPEQPDSPYTLGYEEPRRHKGTYLQLVWAANTLNNGYYGWRSGNLTQFDHPDGRMERPDPWQNAASVGIQYYFSRILHKSAYERAIGPEGLLATYRDLFGDPWADETVLIPGSLQQPDLRLPFPPGRTWTYTGGPHTGWGEGEPLAGLDFAPPSNYSGCFIAEPQQYATAMADGLVVRSETGIVVLDLDGDGNERTGWVIFYLHVGTDGRAQQGDVLHAGDPIGYPSCEGGRTTGSHVHIVRKYNGEWIIADGPLPFNMEGWIAHNGSRPYKGTLTRNGITVTASDVSDIYSQLTSKK